MLFTNSLWNITSLTAPPFSTLRDGDHVDVAIIGAGITGLTAAILLRERGKRVAVLEMDRVASGESAMTTAHVTEAIDVRYRHIRRAFDHDAARIVAATLRAAIETIDSIVTRYSIDCAWRRVPGFLYTERRNKVADLKSEAVSASESGVAAKWTAEVPLPFSTRGAVRFENQALFHPRRYLLGIANEIAAHVVEGVHVLHIDESDPCTVETSAGRITADAVFVATHAPINDVLLHTKVAPYRSYAIAMHTEAPVEGLFWDTADPYHYIRSHDDFLIIGGEDHKVGQEVDTEECFTRLQQYAIERFGAHPVRHQWSGQIIESHDGLPFIGATGRAGRIYLATGYAGQGMTLGTAAATIVADLIEGRSHPAAPLFDPGRIHPRGSVRDFVTENVDYPKRILLDRVLRRDVETTRTFDVKSGEGKIVMVDGRKLAVSRDQAGRLHAVSPVCTHMRCDVAWNSAEQTWDCPCHGSRFSMEGEVRNGPATEGLEGVRIDES